MQGRNVILGIVFAAGCGSTVSEPADPLEPGEVRRITLEGGIIDSEGIVLETADVFPVSTGDTDHTDFHLFARQVIGLSRGEPHAFCVVGEGFRFVEEIPTDPEGCDWGPIYLGGNAAYDRGTPTIGAIARDRAEDRLYRILVVDHGVSEDDWVANATFDLTRVD